MVTYLCCVLMLFLSASVFPLVKDPPEPKPEGPIIPGLPIDGGLSLLIIIGAAYGVYAIKKRLKD